MNCALKYKTTESLGWEEGNRREVSEYRARHRTLKTPKIITIKGNIHQLDIIKHQNEELMVQVKPCQEDEKTSYREGEFICKPCI